MVNPFNPGYCCLTTQLKVRRLATLDNPYRRRLRRRPQFDEIFYKLPVERAKKLKMPSSLLQLRASSSSSSVRCLLLIIENLVNA